MADQDTAVKDDVQELGELVPVVDVQRRLSEMMNRAAFANERFVLTRNGKQTAALIGIRDLERLRTLDGAA
jgi:prevent-host-death family protein